MAEGYGKDHWKNATNYESFELRAHRFRPELRPVFFAWLGIKPDSRVLDAGCGSGVFTRYLAGGLEAGHITSFDISPAFVEFGNRRHAELGLSARILLEVQDGYALSYPDDHFDAVTNYTYVGTLEDPEAGMREMVRVCKPGGTVSSVIASNALPRAGYEGCFPFDPDGTLGRLVQRENRAFSDIVGVAYANHMNELEATRKVGLRDIRLFPFAHLICFSDAGVPLEYRRALALDETREEISWLRSRFSQNEAEYEKRGFRRRDYEELASLLEQKYAHYETDFETDQSFEWHGGYNYIVTGVK